MYIIRKEFEFSASHALGGLPQDHPCSNLHGHNYKVTLELRNSMLTPVGFVKDYRALNAFKVWLDELLDHQHLNEAFNFNPTAENMAKFIFEDWVKTWPELFAVEVSETPKTSARYERD